MILNISEGCHRLASFCITISEFIGYLRNSIYWQQIYSGNHLCGGGALTTKSTVKVAG